MDRSLWFTKLLNRSSDSLDHKLTEWFASCCPPVCLNAFSPACLPPCLSVCLSACLPVSLSVCLPACIDRPIDLHACLKYPDYSLYTSSFVMSDQLPC